ncbi:hypothetical protein GQ43DRAFT_436769 [Delitschia confertaspora ATCC 74209]|uniref:Mitochondrial outer membrane protein OM14 C-terminal domain-containing protein n=1 Tax=Delitschia confertaspora ATCC 74209 TaxID=1513339 RepID=A0A9P4JWQ0_9PLEO|nr:hypothetical protein GQ43DRAFT_436769 [Delitschia confertaspora ATCC 74209]
MSYAQAAASGPKQSPEEARAPPIPQVEKTDESVHSLIDVDSPHVSSVPSDFESQSIKTDTQAERIELEERAEEAAKEAKAAMEKAKDKAEHKAKKGKESVRKNADNPVILGNALTVTLLGAALGVGAYRKWTRNELTAKVVGTWAGVVGLFALGDYFVSQYFFKKYPTKK